MVGEANIMESVLDIGFCVNVNYIALFFVCAERTCSAYVFVFIRYNLNILAHSNEYLRCLLPLPQPQAPYQFASSIVMCFYSSYHITVYFSVYSLRASHHSQLRSLAFAPFILAGVNDYPKIYNTIWWCPHVVWPVYKQPFDYSLIFMIM